MCPSPELFYLLAVCRLYLQHQLAESLLLTLAQVFVALVAFPAVLVLTLDLRLEVLPNARKQIRTVAPLCESVLYPLPLSLIENTSPVLRLYRLDELSPVGTHNKYFGMMGLFCYCCCSIHKPSSILEGRLSLTSDIYSRRGAERLHDYFSYF